MHGLSLIPDETLLIQIALFFTSYLVMRFLVFQPYLQLLEARHAKTDGLKQKAADHAERAEQFRLDYESVMLEEKQKVAKILEEGRQSINADENALLAQARSEVGKELETVRAGIASDIAEARTNLDPQVPEFASAMSTKLLGKEVRLKSNNSQTPAGDQPVAPG